MSTAILYIIHMLNPKLKQGLAYETENGLYNVETMFKIWKQSEQTPGKQQDF